MYPTFLCDGHFCQGNCIYYILIRVSQENIMVTSFTLRFESGFLEYESDVPSRGLCRSHASSHAVESGILTAVFFL
jgi:hypothetical protein